MSHAARGRIGRIVLVVALALATGCASLRLPAAPVPDIANQQRKRREQAVADFDQKRDTAEYQAALSCWRHGDVAGCRQTLVSLLKRNPKHRQAGLLLAELHLADQQPEEARRQAEAVLALYPDDAQAHHVLGLALEAAGQGEAARSHFEQAVQLDPKNETYALSRQTAAEPIEPVAFASDQPVAERAAKSNAQFGPAGALLDEGDRALSSGDKPAALASFRQAMTAQPGNPRVALRAAAIAIAHNEPDLAVAVVNDALRLFPDSAALYRMLGTSHYRRGDMKSSQAALSRAIALDKSDALAYFLMGATLRRLGQSEAAASFEQQAATLDPRYRR